jgi:hypothetical protein
MPIPPSASEFDVYSSPVTHLWIIGRHEPHVLVQGGKDNPPLEPLPQDSNLAPTIQKPSLSMFFLFMWNTRTITYHQINILGTPQIYTHPCWLYWPQQNVVVWVRSEPMKTAILLWRGHLPLEPCWLPTSLFYSLLNALQSPINHQDVNPCLWNINLLKDKLTVQGMKQTMRILLPLASEYLARHLVRISSDDWSGGQSWLSLAIAMSSCLTDVWQAFPRVQVWDDCSIL